MGRMSTKRSGVVFLGVLAATVLIGATRTAAPEESTSVEIPRTWDDQAVASMGLHVANPAYSPVQAPSDYYYRMTVRPIYKTYPVYGPRKGTAR